MNQPPPFRWPPSKVSLRGVILVGLLLLMLPGLLGSQSAAASGFAGGALIIALPVAFLWLLSRGVDRTIRRRR